MPIERNLNKSSDDNYNPSGQSVSNITLNASERLEKGSSMEVRPDGMTTLKRDSLEVEVGESIFNIDTNKNEYWNGTSWIPYPSIDSSTRVTGWAQYGDSQHTELSPLSIQSGNTSIINIDGLTNTVKTNLPTGVSDLYDTSTSKITPVSEGDYYTATLQFKAKNSSSNGDATVFFDLGGSFPRLFASTFRFNRGAGVGHEYYLTFCFYSLGTFIANGGLIKMEAGVGNTELYDVILQINKTHNA